LNYVSHAGHIIVGMRRRMFQAQAARASRLAGS